MTRFRLTLTVDAEDLSEVIVTATRAALLRDYDPEIALNLMQPPPEPVPESTPWTPIVAAKTQRKRTAGGDDWPRKDSIYSVVLEALADGPLQGPELRAALKARGFSTNSLNSTLSRLSKRGKAKPTDDGGWVAVNT